MDNFEHQTECEDQSRRLLEALQIAIECLISRADGESPLFNMPVLQLKCLRVISRNEGQKLVNIATLMRSSTPGVSRLVDRLVRQGLVQREQDPLNRRAVRLLTTDDAKAMLTQIDEVRCKHVQNCIEGLNPALIDQMTRTIRTVTDNAKVQLAVHARAELRQWNAESANTSQPPIV